MTAQDRSTKSFSDLIEKEDLVLHKQENRLFHDISIRIAKLINIVFMTMPFAIAWYQCYADKTWVHFYMRGHWLVIGLFVFLYFMIGKVYEAFKMSYNSIGEMVYSQALTCLEADVIMYIVAFLLIRRLPNVVPMVLVFLTQILVSIIWSIAAQRWYFKTFPAQRTVIVWDMRESTGQLINKYNLRKKFRVVDIVNVEECIDDLSMLDDADTVFLSGIRSHDRNIIAKYCLLHGITAHLVPRVGDLIITGAKRSNMFHEQDAVHGLFVVVNRIILLSCKLT